MLVSTWNICSYTRDKQAAVTRLVRKADIICLTERSTPVPETPNWLNVNCLPPPDQSGWLKFGGVSVLHIGALPFKHISSYSKPHLQLIHCLINHMQVLAYYISPHSTTDELSRALILAHDCLRVPGILVGHFNARHHKWDDMWNRRGTALHKWAHDHHFCTQRTREQTCRTPQSSSRIDIVLHCGPAPPSIRALPFTPFRITAQLRLN